MAVNGVLFGCIVSFCWDWMPHTMVKSRWWPRPWTNVVRTWIMGLCSFCIRSGSLDSPLFQNAFLRSTWTESSTELRAGCVYQGYVDNLSYQWGECGSCDHWSVKEMVFNSRRKCCMICALTSTRTTSWRGSFFEYTGSWIYSESKICIDEIWVWCIG